VVAITTAIIFIVIFLFILLEFYSKDL